jgi:hypothetical protein
MQRPTGVTVLAILCFIWGGAEVDFTIRLMNLFIKANHAGGVWLPMVYGVWPPMVLGLVFCLAYTAVCAVVGYGLLRLKNWGRIAAIVFASLAIINKLTRLMMLNSTFQSVNPTFRGYFSLLFIGLSGWTLYYLTRARVKQAFSTTEA